MGVSGLVVVFLLLLATQVQAQSIGCFTDKPDRDLNGPVATPPGNTNEVCRQICKDKGYQFSGTQYGAHCFCGNSYGKYGTATKCNSPCVGNSAEKCGGDFANSVSRTGAGTPISLSPPNAPILLSPKDTIRSNWQPAVVATQTTVGAQIPLTWQVTGTPNNFYQVMHWLDFWRWNNATRAWEAVFQNYSGGPAPINSKLTQSMQVARGTCYAWIVWGINPQRNTNPWFTPSGWSGFCTS